MASIAKTAFEVSVSNITRNNIQNVPGYFGSGTGTSFVPDICPAGFLCTRSELAANEGYEGKGANGADILNGNTWRFIAAAAGTSGNRLGDHTGIYAFNSYNAQQGTIGGNTYYAGANTLGLELPAGERGDFTELIVGEQYTWGAENFSTAPTDSTFLYATIVNGLLVASKTAPADGSGVYLKILRSKPFTKGARYAGFNGYVCEVCRAAAAKS